MAPSKRDAVDRVLVEVFAERERQHAKWDANHDDAHLPGVLSDAACMMVMQAPVVHSYPGPHWAWDLRKKMAAAGAPFEGDRRGRLIVAAALIVAEIERLDRAVRTAPAVRGVEEGGDGHE